MLSATLRSIPVRRRFKAIRYMRSYGASWERVYANYPVMGRLYKLTRT